MKLESGKRVYVPSTKTFGTIVRQGGILGLNTSYAIVDDVGKRSVFVGNNMEFVYVDSSQKPGGEAMKIPPDVVPQLAKKYSPSESKKLTVDLYKTDLAEREEAYRTLMETIDPSQDSKTSSEKTSSEKTSSEKTTAKKTIAKKTTAKKTTAKKTTAEKTTTEKTTAKKTSSVKTTEDKRPATRKRKSTKSAE